MLARPHGGLVGDRPANRRRGSGSGTARLIRGEEIKSGAVVIDAGYNPDNVGDVDFGTARPRAHLNSGVWRGRANLDLLRRRILHSP